MAGRKSRLKRPQRPEGITDPAPRRRSLVAPLMWAGAAVLIGFPILRDATADKMVRNQYRDVASCECDYGQGQCSYHDGAYVGPWYAGPTTARDASDPGTGACYTRHGNTRIFVGAGGTSEYRPPMGVEHGYRGGFGGTGRVRAAGS